jgi:hypothetical protein
MRLPGHLPQPLRWYYLHAKTGAARRRAPTCRNREPLVPHVTPEVANTVVPSLSPSLSEVTNPGQRNEHHVDLSTGDVTLDLLAQILGPIEVIAIGPPDNPLPVTGHCSCCGSPTTVYGPRGRPLCDRCRAARR